MSNFQEEHATLQRNLVLDDEYLRLATEGNVKADIVQRLEALHRRLPASAASLAIAELMREIGEEGLKAFEEAERIEAARQHPAAAERMYTQVQHRQLLGRALFNIDHPDGEEHPV